jgi:hypothetical protein
MPGLLKDDKRNENMMIHDMILLLTPKRLLHSSGCGRALGTT